LPPYTIAVSEDGLTALVPLHARDRRTVRAYALIDAADAVWASQWRWSLVNGYASRAECGSAGKTIRFSLHRELLGLAPGDGLDVDHRNRNRLDNRRSNLRILPRAGYPNNQNVPSDAGASSQYRGVSWNGRDKRWMAAVRVNGVQHRLGGFTDEREAAEAARAARARLMPYSVD